MEISVCSSAKKTQAHLVHGDLFIGVYFHIFAEDSSWRGEVYSCSSHHTQKAKKEPARRYRSVVCPYFDQAIQVIPGGQAVANFRGSSLNACVVPRPRPPPTHFFLVLRQIFISSNRRGKIELKLATLPRFIILTMHVVRRFSSLAFTMPALVGVAMLALLGCEGPWSYECSRAPLPLVGSTSSAWLSYSCQPQSIHRKLNACRTWLPNSCPLRLSPAPLFATTPKPQNSVYKTRRSPPQRPTSPGSRPETRRNEQRASIMCASCC